jgi:starvation-inducible DNA-binding protein
MTKTETAPREARKASALKTPSDLDPKGVVAIEGELRQLLADVFALYVKTKNFHWHMSGPISGITTCSSTSKRSRSSP